MQDIYSSIIGEPVSEQEKLQAIAQQLRKRQMIGQLGQITGDKVLAPMGTGMVETANAQAEDIGRRGEQARYRRYQEKASAMADERARQEQAWREKDAIEDRALRKSLAELAARTTLEAARLKSSDKPKYKAMTVTQVDKMTNDVAHARNLLDTFGRFKDEYAGYGLTAIRGGLNALSSAAPMFTTEQQEEAARWWAEFDNLYTLMERNEIFGATLTPNEQASWKKQAISEGMSAKEIKARLAWYRHKIESKLQAKHRNLKMSDYDPDLIDTIFTDFRGEGAGEPPIVLPPRNRPHR